MVRYKNPWPVVEFVDISTVDASSATAPLNTRSLDEILIYSALGDSRIVTNFGNTGWEVVGMSLTGASVPRRPSAFHRSDDDTFQKHSTQGKMDFMSFEKLALHAMVGELWVCVTVRNPGESRTR
ncbi:uncharacterized protein EDB91DRAFT_1140903 [Suillus paluster]|uniref:uncharacterized protein n=1 Tax=Suillus paluster TaxID=48578 RepID=UPI001B875237|nr:uncharacterized protein EDB91DRAFT_1140903 [Suillus paluster]KAG1737072.1 hypothetical protein EDB91DRAFT_1140903 [Suillus paluster]